MSTRRWYLEVFGKLTGPFTADDIADLVREGEVPPTTPAVAEDDASIRLSASELETRFRKVETGGEDTKVGIMLPTRPADLGKSATAAPRPGDDPSIGLLDALIATKERKREQRESFFSHSDAGPSTAPSHRGGWFGQNPMNWILACLALVAGASIYLMTQMLKKGGDSLDTHPSKAESAAVKTVKEAPAPDAAPAAPAAAPATPRLTATPRPRLTPTTPATHDAERDHERETEREQPAEPESEAKGHPGKKAKPKKSASGEGGEPDGFADEENPTEETEAPAND